jgi:hypothetical protein
MNTQAIIFFGSSFVSLLIALFIFSKGLDIKALLFLIFGLAAVILFNLALKEIRKDNRD